MKSILKRQLSKKLQAVTLTEVLVAMSLLGVVLTFGMMITDRIMMEGTKPHALVAQSYVDQVIHQIKQKQPQGAQQGYDQPYTQANVTANGTANGPEYGQAQKYLDFEQEFDLFNVLVIFNKSAISKHLVEVSLEVFEPNSNTVVLKEKILLQTPESNWGLPAHILSPWKGIQKKHKPLLSWSYW